MIDWIFDSSLWLPTLIGLAGVVVFIEGNRRTNRRLRALGVGIFLVSIALFTLGRVVDTDSKKVNRASQELIDGVKQGQWDKVSAILEPDAEVWLPQTPRPLFRGADAIIDAAKNATSNWPLSGTMIESLKLDQNDATHITATMTLRSSFAAYPAAMVPSIWELDWVKDGKTWRVHEIHPIQIGDRTGPDMGTVLGRK